MISVFFAILIGFVGLLWSADRLVLGASNIARIFGMPPFLIGLTVVAIGTSTPELFLCISSAMQQQLSTAVGNAVGSNIANIGLVLGLSAIVAPIRIHQSIFQRELPMMLVVTFLAGGLLWPLVVYRIEGILLILLFVAMTTWFVYQAKRHREEIITESPELPNKSLPVAIAWLIVGLVLLPLSSDYLVKNAVILAAHLGMSEIMIGLTILAIGSSLPELAASAVSAYQKQSDLAVGNVVGSNLFNLTFAMGPAIAIYPDTLPHSLQSRDLPFMFGITLALFAMALFWKKTRVISRFGGCALFLSYIVYLYIMALGELKL